MCFFDVFMEKVCVTTYSSTILIHLLVFYFFRLEVELLGQV